MRFPISVLYWSNACVACTVSEDYCRRSAKLRIFHMVEFGITARTPEAGRLRLAGSRATNRSSHSPIFTYCCIKSAFHDADTDSDSPDTPTSLRPTRAISWSYSCSKLNDTPTFTRQSSRGCRRGCWCRRRGMRSLRDHNPPTLQTDRQTVGQTDGRTDVVLVVES